MSGQVRIISGRWKGRKLPVINSAGLRPSTDRTKETLFNWLMHDIYNSRCLDAFAGSGSLGFEALSRGANEVVMYEKDKAAAQSLKKNNATLSGNAKIVVGDSLQLIKRETKPYDIVFIDPPFGHNLVNTFLELVLKQNLLSPSALIYLEYESAFSFEQSKDLRLLKEKKTSQYIYALYQLNQS